jgi:hypothetical protein
MTFSAVCERGGAPAMRDLMMLGMMMVIVPIALSNAFAAYLVWGWTSVIAVPYYMWGFMGSLRYNLFFALVTLLLLVVGKSVDKSPFRLNRTSALILLFVAHVTVSAVLADAVPCWRTLVRATISPSTRIC